MMIMTSQVEVTQADREFVASRYSKHSGDIHRRILAGEYDAFNDVQSAARFRVQSTAEVTAHRDALAGVLMEALGDPELLLQPAWVDEALATLASVKGHKQC